MRSDTVLTTIFVLVVAAVLVGGSYVYTLDPGRYSSSIKVTDDGLEYSVTSAGSTNYSVLVLDNDTFERIETYYIYYDEDYGSKLEVVPVPVGAKTFTQDYYISQLVKMLENRGIRNIKILDAGELGKVVKDLTDTAKKGLVVLSGALPDTVYTGNPNDPILKWIEDGGTLYWAGNLLGAYYAEAGGRTVEVADRGIFFGAGSLNEDGGEWAMSDVTANDYRHSLSMRNNGIRYGISVSVAGAMAVGYTDGEYGSAVMVGLGKGMVCVLGGDYSNEQRHDLAQIISSGICHLTTDAGYAKGDVKRGTATGTIPVSFEDGKNYAVYVYYGGYFPIYGKTWEVVP